MRISILVLVFTIMVLCGCTTVEQPKVSFVPVSTVPKIFEGNTKDSDGIYPAEVVMDKVNYGDELSTWTDNTPELGIDKNTPLAVYIFNRTLEQVVYNIEYAIPDKQLGNYSVAPLVMRFYTEISSSFISIPPETVGIIPVRVIIPDKKSGVELPEKWAFQIYVKPVQSGNIQKAYKQNWLIGMDK